MKEHSTLFSVLKRNVLAKYIHKMTIKNFPDNEIDIYAYKCPWEHYPGNLAEVEEIIVNYDVVLVLTEFSIRNITHKLKETKKYNFRVAHSPLSDETIFYSDGPLDVDNEKLNMDTLLLYSKIKKADTIIIKNNNETHLEVIIDDKKIFYETSILDEPGKEINLPAGEIVLFQPNITGKFITPTAWIQGLSSPLTITIEKGKIVEIEGGIGFSDFVNSIKNSSPKLSQLVIGMNEKAKNPFSPIEVEKMKGVVNIVISVEIKDKHPFLTSSFTGHFPSPGITIEANDKVIFSQGKICED